MIDFAIGASGQTLRLTSAVLSHFDKNRQTRFWHREAGGLLFVRFDLPTIVVAEATGPRPNDSRTRYSYSPDVQGERTEIEQRFRAGLHFIGCWHTHPEDHPTPSRVDIRNTTDCMQRSKHALNGFVLVIVGRKSGLPGLFVSVCDRNSVHRLQSAATADIVPLLTAS